MHIKREGAKLVTILVNLPEQLESRTVCDEHPENHRYGPRWRRETGKNPTATRIQRMNGKLVWRESVIDWDDN